MNGKKPYFKNNWKKWKSIPDEMFETHLFEEVMEWKVAGWELPMDVFCLIRTTNKKNKKVKEYVYKRPLAANRKIAQLALNTNLELVVVTHEAQHGLASNYVDDEGDF